MRRPLVFPLIIALGFSFFAQDTAASPVEKALTDSALLERLQSGGLVIVFRHGNTGSDSDRADAGRGELRKIADSIRKIGILIGEVFASPMCRTRETAWLLVGQVASSDALIGPENDIRNHLLTTIPADGTNRVLVSHGYVVRSIVSDLEGAAANEFVPRGYGFVLEPYGSGNFEVLARLGPDDWVRVASLAEK